MLKNFIWLVSTNIINKSNKCADKHQAEYLLKEINPIKYEHF